MCLLATYQKINITERNTSALQSYSIQPRIPNFTPLKSFLPMLNTLFVGKVCTHLHSVDSTNQYATSLLAKSKPTEGTVITAFQQTNGRGQIDSSWDAQPGANITCSIILYPKFLHPTKQHLLSKAVALAVFHTVRHYTPTSHNVYIKWPNDIYIQHAKVAGILIQNALSTNGLYQSAIVGIGLNVNQQTFNPNVPNATSLCHLHQHPLDTTQVLHTLLTYIEQYYLLLKNNHTETLQQQYETRLLGKNQTLSFLDLRTHTPFTGSLLGTNPHNGHLRILNHTQQIEQQFDIKEIKFMLPTP